MKVHLKKVRDQVIVITGASSGIGLATAREAARRGARLVLACRNEAALHSVADALRHEAADIVTVRADVGILEDHAHILNAALERFGRVDTWINNAGVSIFGRLEDVAVEDQRRLFETNFWGVVYGSSTAVAHLKRHGGALINLGSELSDRAIPLQGMYSASKHAVKGYTDALRMELEAEGAPVSITLIKPAAVDTAFVTHAKNYMDVEPKLPMPIYAPEVVADAILYAAEHPSRDLYVGGAARLMAGAGQRAPRLMDRMANVLMRSQRTDEPATDRPGILYEPAGGDDEATHESPRHVRRHSTYTHLATHGRGAAWVGLGLAISAAAAAYLATTDRLPRPRLRSAHS
jgi:short-subunit dehydrogenase